MFMTIRHDIAQRRVIVLSRESSSPPRLDTAQLMGQESTFILAHRADE